MFYPAFFVSLKISYSFFLFFTFWCFVSCYQLDLSQFIDGFVLLLLYCYICRIILLFMDRGSVKAAEALTVTEAQS